MAQRRDVNKALVVGYEDIIAVRIKGLQTSDVESNSTDFQDRPGPPSTERIEQFPCAIEWAQGDYGGKGRKTHQNYKKKLEAVRNANKTRF